MINWGEGFFNGVMLGFSLVILAVECYFLILDKATERQLSAIQLAVLSFLAVVALTLIVTRIAVFSIFLVPAGYLVLMLWQTYQEKIQDAENVSRQIQHLLKKIAQNPEDATAYAELGNVYFRHADYEKALHLYQKAYQLDPVPWLAQKVKVAQREHQIQTGDLWYCPECGSRNTGQAQYCCTCHHPKATIMSVKNDLLQQKKQLKTGILLVSGVALSLLLLSRLIKGFSFFSLIVFFLFLMYLILRGFFTW